MQRGFHLGENLIARGWDAVFLHQVFGEDLAAFDDGGFAAGTETGNSGVLQSINASEDKGIVRRYHSIVDLIGHGECDDGCDILGTDRHTLGILRNAAVAGKRKNLTDLRVFF